ERSCGPPRRPPCRTPPRPKKRPSARAREPPRPEPMATLRLRGRELDLSRGVVMAIVNRTPDSFYAAARFADDDAAALDAVARAVAEGAEIVDVGGIRAGRGPRVEAEEEIARVVPFVAA